jgi:hypothetical protein
MPNKIECYQNNTKDFTCTSPIDATGYTPYFTAKNSISDTDYIINKSGSVTDPSTLYFCLSSMDTSLAAGDYPYDITIEADTSIYTLVKDILSIINGVRY